jgi:hypothetical protein
MSPRPIPILMPMAPPESTVYASPRWPYPTHAARAPAFRRAARRRRARRRWRGELARVGIAERVRAGETVAVTAGSRGITNIALVLRTLIEV